MKKNLMYVVGVVIGVSLSGMYAAAASEPVMPVTPVEAPVVSREPLSLAERIADKKLWLGTKSSDSAAYLSIALHGAGRRFVETGAYDVSVYAKGAKLLVGFPQCNRCTPTGFFSALDLESYIAQTPFWVGVRNLGGGFGHHRHRYYKNQMPAREPSAELQTETLRHVTAYKEQIAAIVLSPALVTGATLGGQWGGWDIAFGVEPSASAFNGGAIPTMHTKFFCETYGYTAPVRYKKFSGRLFVGGQCAAASAGENREWGINLAPGASVSGVFGAQAAWSFLRFGLAYGHQYQGGTRSTITYRNDYLRRAKEYERDNTALAQAHKGERAFMGAAAPQFETVAIPLDIPSALATHSVTSYCAATWRKWTIGLSGQYEWNWSRDVSLSYVRVALGYAF